MSGGAPRTRVTSVWAARPASCQLSAVKPLPLSARSLRSASEQGPADGTGADNFDPASPLSLGHVASLRGRKPLLWTLGCPFPSPLPRAALLPYGHWTC